MPNYDLTPSTASVHFGRFIHLAAKAPCVHGANPLPNRGCVNPIFAG
jgi:hypothetical protein